MWTECHICDQLVKYSSKELCLPIGHTWYMGVYDFTSHPHMVRV